MVYMKIVKLCKGWAYDVLPEGGRYIRRYTSISQTIIPFTWCHLYFFHGDALLDGRHVALEAATQFQLQKDKKQRPESNTFYLLSSNYLKNTDQNQPFSFQVSYLNSHSLMGSGLRYVDLSYSNYILNIFLSKSHFASFYLNKVLSKVGIVII